MSERSTLSCPRCADLLWVGRAAGMTLHACGHCAGIWLGQACATRLAQALPADAVSLAASASRTARVAADTSRPAPCPLCRTVMQRTPVAAASLELDVCRAHGTWYDREELERVAGALGKWRGQSVGLANSTGAGAMAGAAVAGVAGAALVGAAVAGSAAAGSNALASAQNRTLSPDAVDVGEVALDTALELGDVVDVADVAEGSIGLIGAVFSIFEGF